SVPGRQRGVHFLPTQLRRAFASRVTELQADFSRRALVYEFHDGTPGIPLSFIPQSRAARSDAPLGGNTGHFGVYEPGAAHGTVAVMNEVPIVRHAVLGAVLRHWGNHD